MLAAAALLGLSTPALADCAALKAVRIPDVTILAADPVAAGDFRAFGGFGPAQPPITLPAHCRVRAVVAPVPGSRIGFELWLPAARWNGRLKMFGNGGYASALPYAQLANGLAAGYAVTATDTGHQGDDPEFVVGQPQAMIDWGHRAVHLTAVNAKLLARRHFGRAPAHAYFEGCSTGGHQALMSAQRYPGDFDGIIAGAPGNNRTRLNIGFLWQFIANRRAGTGDPILSATRLPLLARAGLDQCGTASERARGYLDNPFACRIDLAKLQCPAAGGDTCLNGEEVQAAAKLYDGARNPRTGAQIYPPWLPGSETGWSAYWADPRDPGQPMRASFFRFWAFRDPAWDWRSFDFDRAVARIPARLRRAIDAVDPDLGAFARRGGKLILYHGLADPVVIPWDTRQYFEAVAARTAGGAAPFARLYFAPGMAHCGGGPGPDLINAQPVLENWVERGAAPDRLAIAGRDGAASSLCPFPGIGSDCR